ncbi:MAG: hypothetical protein J5548_13765 [Prevotella sp.]|nr:hypothetical protein [Prevotella sp.]
MALIKCRECGQVVSDKAVKCPKCGCPINEETHYFQSDEPMVLRRQPNRGGGNGNKWLYAILSFLLAAVIGGGIFYFIDKNNQKEEVFQQQQQQSQHVADSIAKAQARQDSIDKLKAEAQPRVAPQPRVVTIEGYHHLVGSISKYPITMDIQVSGGDVQGTYYYHSQGRNSKMSVYGSLNGNQLTLEEYAPDGNNTGYFEGTFNGYSFSGTFVNYLKGNTLSFNVVEQ